MTDDTPSPRFAIVGIGCRFPGGADSAQSFWSLLASGRDAITAIPADRPEWVDLYDPDPAAAGRIYTRLGGFLEGIDGFDAAFFGISPREATRIDPQQRLLLEVTWEAFEDARIPIDRFAGDQAGVFVGISTHDYADVQMYPQHRAAIDAYSNTGGAGAIAPNRLSYAFDFTGPSMAVDTACSSALTAVHLACRALQNGDCRIAVAGGVQVLLRPELTVGFCRATMLSPEGHCKAFDAAADGYVRSEGAGVVLVRRLEDALAEGDRIYAIIAATAINQDGHSAGLTVPNEHSQQDMLRTALARARMPADRIAYVEAHGTGTPVGDPIEARAIGTLFGAERGAAGPLWLGSVKANIGHLEAASGIAGLIKTALCLYHRQVPPQLHFRQWNPAIDATGLNLRVPLRLEELTTGFLPVAAVNSFGFGGANACAILEASSRNDAPPPPDTNSGAAVLVLSARSPAALKALAAATGELLRTTTAPPASLCAGAALGRAHQPHRLAIVGTCAEQLADGLDSYLVGESRAGIVHGKASGSGRLVFVYAGMGPQWWGMGRQLLASEPVFRAMLERCDAALRPVSGWSLLAQFGASEAQSRLADPELAQVSNFALQVALTALWESWGISPDAVIGHSGGAMAAAYHAGVHSLEESIVLCYHRSRLQGRPSNGGRMLAVGLAPEAADELLRGKEAAVAVAAINGPGGFTLAGDAATLEEIAAELTERQVFNRFLQVTIAYHSPKMDPIRSEFLAAVNGLQGRAARLPLLSDTTGDWISGTECDAAYWWRAIRQPVLFGAGIGRLLEAGYDRFVELSPHPVLATAIAECAAVTQATPLVLPSLRRKEDERGCLLRSLAALFVVGRQVRWEALYRRDFQAPLAPYPWQRERHWFEPDTGPVSTGAIVSGTEAAHPLLQRRLAAAQPTWQASLADRRLDYLAAHEIRDAVIFPGAGYVEAAFAAAASRQPDALPLTLRQVEFHKPLLLGERGGNTLQLSLDPETGRFDISGPDPSQPGEWQRYASGRCGAGGTTPPAASPVADRLAGFAAAGNPDTLYAELRRRGLHYGPAFRGIAELRGDGVAIAGRVGPVEGLDCNAYHFHPALLDGVFQLLAARALQLPQASAERLFLPTGIDEIRLYRAAGPECWAVCRLDQDGYSSVSGSFEVFTPDGAPVATIRGLRARLLDAERDEGALDSLLYDYRWEAAYAPVDRETRQRGSILGQRTPAWRRSADATVSARAAQSGWSGYYHSAEALLNARAAAHVEQAFRTLGLESGAGARPGDAELSKVAARDPSGGLWTQRLRDLLDLRGTGPVEPVSPPAYALDFALLDAAGGTLAAALSGQRSDGLVTETTLPLLQDFYATAPASAFYNGVLAEVLDPLIAAANPAASLRILEVGAGTGGTTRALLQRLPRERCQYLVTDTAPTLLDAARNRLGAAAGIDYALLDIAVDPLTQGYAACAFDLIVAANVVHATADIATTLGHLHSLLVPGGTLALIEITRDPPWLDVIFGQTRGWWSFTDRELRPRSPLLDRRRWETVLAAAGFEEPWTSREPEAPGEAAQTVMLASRPLTGITARTWRLVGDDTPHRASLAGAKLAAALESTGAAIAREEAADMPAPIAGIVYFATGNDTEQGFGAALERFVKFYQPLAQVPLWLVTQGATRLPDDTVDDPSQALLVGFARTAMREQPELPLRVIDIGVGADTTVIAALARELEAPGGEEELALRAGQRLVRRLRRARLAELPPRGDLVADGPQWSAAVGVRGALGTLSLRATPAPRLAANEISIRVAAAALNYRDVMLATGGIAGLEEDVSFGGGRLGSDCAGIIVECGADVTGLVPGQAVFAMARGSLGSMAVTDARLAAALPPNLDFTAAATVPTAFLTAWYALCHLARIERGERVLIHAATGGVGLAAIQLCHARGAEIFATAGSTAKRAYLAEMGIGHVMDSRSLDFADQVRERTGGAGVDVVLNSVAGEAIERGIAALAPYGRFLEIGKRDIYGDRALFLSPFRRNLSYFAIDLDQAAAQRPDLIGAMLTAIRAEFVAGQLTPLPIQVFSVAELEQAFRLMAQARHIGKIVLNGFADPGPIAAAPLPTSPIRRDGSYVVSGGFGGFGLALVEHLATAGAGAVAVLSRQAPGGEAAEHLAGLHARGLRIEHFPCDVASAAAVSEALSLITTRLPPVRGIFHAAMVLDDRRIAELDAASLERVLRPKAAGAWALHQASTGLPLELFVMFSSITAPLGNPLQSNYGAANAYLAALSAHRRAQGLPALTLDWGVLADAGYVAARPELRDFLEHQGYRAFSAEIALKVMDALLSRDVADVMVADIDWRRLAAYSPRAAASARLRDLVPVGEEAGAASAQGLRRELADLPAALWPERIGDFIAQAVSRVLGLPAAQIERDLRLDAMGLDSLLAVELTTLINVELGVELPVLRLLDGMSVDRLAALIGAECQAAQPASAVAPAPAAMSPPAPIATPAPAPQALPEKPPAAPAAPPLTAESLAEAPPWTGLPRAAQALGRRLLGMLARVDVEGLETLPRSGSYILAVNHLSMADVPVAFTLVPHRTIILAASKLRRSRVLRWILEDLGQSIFVRGDIDTSEALQRAAAVLQDGGVIALSPEGTRSRGGLIRARTGIAHLAAATQRPVIPYAAWGQEQWRTRLRRAARLQITVRVGVALPPPPRSASPAELRDYADRVMHAIAALLPPEYRGVYAESHARSEP